MSERYPESGVMKEVVVKYNRQENGYNLLEPRDNGGISSFYEEIVNSVRRKNV